MCTLDGSILFWAFCQLSATRITCLSPPVQSLSFPSQFFCPPISPHALSLSLSVSHLCATCLVIPLSLHFKPAKYPVHVDLLISQFSLAALEARSSNASCISILFCQFVGLYFGTLKLMGEKKRYFFLAKYILFI